MTPTMPATFPTLSTLHDPHADKAQQFRRAMEAAVADLKEKIDAAAMGGPERMREKHLARGKLLPRQRVERLLDPGTVAIGPLVLGAERLLKRHQRGPIEAAGGQWHAQFKRLPLVMQAGAAPDLDMVGGKAVLGEPGARLGFEAVDDFLHLGRRECAQQPLAGAGEVVLDLGVEQAEG